MSGGAGRSTDWAVLAAGLALATLSLLTTIRAPVMPDTGLDPSWAYATQFAAQHALVFGRDFVFAYGPYGDLVTGLYAPQTFARDVFYEAFCIVAIFWTPIAMRSLTAAGALAIALAVSSPFPDAIYVGAIFGVFLMALGRRGLWAAPFAALCGPLALAKYSLAPLILPLLLLADARRLAAGRAPVMTLAFAAGALVADLAAGQPLGALPDLASTTLQVVLGYGAAMQASGPPQELALALELGGAAAALVLVLAWRGGRADDLTAAAIASGFAWALFLAFKMGFVRQDAWHSPIWHQALPLLVALAFAALARPAAWPPARTAFLVLFAAIMAGGVFWQAMLTEPGPTPLADLKAYAASNAADLASRVRQAPARLAGGGPALAAARTEAVEGLARPFPAAVTGTVDVVPSELSEIIAANLDYDPRPVPQSYASFTPGLQRLDLAHFDGPTAPQSLFLKVEDIDGRLPTLALGPSLPVIGERYDMVGADPDLGMILRRRATPRAAAVSTSPEAPLPLDRWVPAAGRPGSLLMARFVVQPSLAGKLLAFAFRAPQMHIALRTAGGRVYQGRFIPGMAQLGVAISPLPDSWSDVAPLFDSHAAAGADAVTALRLSTDGAPWAFASARVQFEQVVIAPGFAAAKTAP